MEEANKLIGAGKKFLVMGKAVEAVSALQDACGMLAKKYGDTADECGEAFFWCGKALLDLARMENSVLGNALEGVPEEDEDEDKPKDSNVDTPENDEKARDELRVQVYDAMAEKKNDAEEADGKKNAEAAEESKVEKSKDADEQEKMEKMEGEGEKTSEGSGGNADATKKENKETDKEPEEEESAEKQEEAGDEEEDDVEGDADEQGEGDAEKDSEDEEVGNLQLAWEMLEVAKVIYKRKDTKEDQLMAAQAHLKLGEVSAESGNYTQALEDFRECLKLQVTHLDSDSRLLAETYYQLGVTYSMNLQYSRAIESLNSSISAIKSRLEKLQKMLDEADGPDALPDERKELEELKALLPEIQEKVEDATEGQKMASTAAEAVKGALDGGSTSAFSGVGVNSGDASSSSEVKSSLSNSSPSGQTPKAPVSDISHLVRKKRKPESPVKEGNGKKVKQDDDHEPQTNGVHKTNGESNGHADNMEVASH